MFLSDPSRSLQGRAHPDKKLSDNKFTKKNWSRATKGYDLEQKFPSGTPPEEDSPPEDEPDEDHEGDSINLNDTDGEVNEDEAEDVDDDFVENDEDDYEEEEGESDYEETGTSKGVGKILKGKLTPVASSSKATGKARNIRPGLSQNQVYQEDDDDEDEDDDADYETERDGKGPLYVEEDVMVDEDAEDDARAQRWDARDNA